jgi:pyruvate dehydrogenase E1 component alpha subunit
MWRPEPSLTDLPDRIAEAGLDREALLESYRQMCLIRFFEEAIQDRYRRGKTPTPNMATGPVRGEMHLALGHEAVAVGVCALLGDADAVVSTHRAHHHALAKGVDPGRTAAEMFGKATGLCRGKGGEMHLFAREQRFINSGIVGASYPQAAGAAFGFKCRGKRNVAVAFSGEGAANHGTFSETLNIAALWQLPLVIVIEDNLYADSTPKWAGLAVNQQFQHAQSYSIPAYLVDGMDVVDVHAAAKRAVDRARDGYGPTLIEAVCYRYSGHFEGDAEEYRTREEKERWREVDPIPRLANRLFRLGMADDAALTGIRREAEREVARAVSFAEESPLPDRAEATRGVFA